jgi:hypothetical protein
MLFKVTEIAARRDAIFCVDFVEFFSHSPKLTISLVAAIAQTREMSLFIQ